MKIFPQSKHKGGENIKKQKLILILIVIVTLTVNTVCAEDNQTAADTLEASDSINIHVTDSYIKENSTWTEDGCDLENATVNLYNETNNNLIFTGSTNSTGDLKISNIPNGKYSIEITYSTYPPCIKNIDTSKTNRISHMFIPDILLLVDYNSHSEKVDMLMEMSKRIAYISTTDFDKTREWLFEYAGFIHIDMFSEGSYQTLTTQYLKELLETSPANSNYRIAYTFGIYSDSLLNTTGMHIIGATPENNTFNTIENTYIGSYFQAEDILDNTTLTKNMENYLSYIYYLINPEKYTNPTVENAPLMLPECGFYHPELGMYTIVPEPELINLWIQTNPGYDADGQGSLNWMITDYPNWLVNTLDPSALFEKFEENYTSTYSPAKGFTAIATYYVGGDVVDSLIKTLEAQGRPAFNIFKTGTTPSMSSLLNKITKTTKTGISTIISLYSWSLNYANGSAEEDLIDIDLPVLKGVYDISQYSYESELGPQVEWTFSVTYPSFEGVYGPVVLSYVDGMGKSHVIQTGVDKMVKLVCGWADLREMENKDKVISIVLYNYPPGKAEIGASYLDVFQSTYDLIFKLGQAGYDIGNISDIPSLSQFTDLIVQFGNKGTWAKGLLNEYVEKNWDYLMQHNQLIDLNEFYRLTSKINTTLYEEMIMKWGDGLGEIMVYNDTYIVIPGMWFGNIFLTFQPSRGWEEVDNYHDLRLPPHQQYVAFYEWLDQKIGVNAIINMGTHGTLEWLPGRNIGVMEGDWTFELTLNPTIYPYIISNPGEAMVARDRIAALMITHMTPAMVSSELYGNYTVLSKYITNYKEQLKVNSSSNAEGYKKLIIDLAPTLGFDKYNENESFDEYMDKLHAYLDSMEDDFYTYGLHNIGKILSGEELIEEVITVTSSQTRIHDYILAHFYPSLAGKSYFDDIHNNEQYVVEDAMVSSFLREYVTALVCGTSAEDLNREYTIVSDSSLYNATLYAANLIVDITNNNEWNAILSALEGKYLKSGLFADPSYGDSLPTGYDGYASDATKMPSRVAFDSAVKIVDLLLANYMEEHGEWPELVALILWGTELSRTEGIAMAEFLYFLGCRPVWASNGNVIGVELLPLDSLTVKLNNGSVVNRPRIDVYASIVTSNKDWLKWMLTGVHLAADANESFTDNFIKMHYNETGTLNRLFGLPGAILEGTGMSTLIPNTADWDKETVSAVSADLYLDRVSFAWNLDEKGNVKITSEKDDFKYLLSKTDLITQNFDSTWRFIDSDDYYDWFGGLYNAARVLGANPDTAFVDIRNQNNYISRTYADELTFEVVSMMTNPRYYSVLFKTEGGFMAYSKNMENLFGGLVMGGIKINTEVGNELARTFLDGIGSVETTAQAAAWQSMAAFMYYLYDMGMWDADPALVEELANKIIDLAVKYGVACCHHTCKNMDFNNKIIQSSTLSPQQKAQYAQILAAATLTDPLFVMDDASENGDGQSESQQSSDEEILVNGTSMNTGGGDASSSGGETSAGDEPSTSQSQAKSASSKASDASASEGASDDSAESQSYEISKSSPAKSVSQQSSMPVAVIAAIILIIAVFLAGYIRGKNNSDDF